jgi:hypothetical protein
MTGPSSDLALSNELIRPNPQPFPPAAGQGDGWPLPSAPKCRYHGPRRRSGGKPAPGTGGYDLDVIDRLKALRSKNAGPFVVTFDVVFRQAEDYKVLKKQLSRDKIATAFRVPEADVLSFDFVDELAAAEPGEPAYLLHFHHSIGIDPRERTRARRK